MDNSKWFFLFLCAVILVEQTVSGPSPYYKVDEYFIEHDISSEQAKRSIDSLPLEDSKCFVHFLTNNRSKIIS